MGRPKNDWKNILDEEYQKPYYVKLQSRLSAAYNEHSVYPAKDDIFNAFHLTSYHSVKIVILGQDPYHGAGQAHGLSFSVPSGIQIPPSLQNIFKELNQDLNVAIPESGCLISWAKEGVLLLNTVLTVEEGHPNSHKGWGWEIFTDHVIHALNDHDAPLVFMLWGKNAQEKASMINSQRHLILKAPHPSPLSAHRGFLGCRHFSTANDFLVHHGQTPINWKIY